MATDPPPDTRLSAEGAARLGGLLAALDRLEPLLALPAHPQVADSPVPFGRYRLRSRLGAGAHGIALLGADPQLGRDVVVKVPQPAVLTDPPACARFAREARTVALLDHPGVVPVLEAGEDAGLPYLVAGYIPGPTLAEWLKRHPAPVPAGTAARLVAALAAAAHHAHERGVLHCDLTPANVLLAPLGPGEPLDRFAPVVTDFGLARLVPDGPALTRIFWVAGTPLYMAPEQARGDRRNLTARTDVYALGAILHELLTGAPPFKGGTAGEVLDRLQADAPAGPRAANPAVPRDLDAICLKCLEKEPARRYTTAAELADDLERFLTGVPTRARPVGPLAFAARWARRRPMLAAAVALAAVAWGAIPAIVVSYSDRLATEAANRRAAELEAAASAASASAAGRRAGEHAFYAKLERVRQRRADPFAGWADESLADLRVLAAAPTAADVLHDLRSEAAAALAAVNLRPVRVVAPGFSAYAPAYSPDGSVLALCGWRADALTQRVRVRLLDPTTGATRRELSAPLGASGEREGCRAVCFSPDGRWLVVGTRNRQFVRWDLTAPTGEGGKEGEGIVWAAQVADAPPGPGAPVALAFSADGGTLYSSSRNGTHAWDVRNGWAVIETRRAVVAPGGTSVLPEAFPMVKLMDGIGWRLCRTALRGEGEPTGVGGSELFTATRDGRLTAIRDAGGKLHLAAADADRDSQSLLGWGDTPLSVTALGFSPDATLLVTAEEHEKRIKLWDVAARRLAVDRAFDGGSGQFAFSPDGRHLAVTEGERTVVYAVTGGTRETLAIVPRTWADTVAVRPDGRALAVLAVDPHGIYELGTWDVVPDRLPVRTSWRPLEHGTCKTPSAAFAPDGSRFAFTTGRDTVTRLETGHRIVCGEKVIEAEDVNDLRFGPDGRLWAADAHSIRVWTIPGWAEEVPLTNDPATAAGMVFRAVAPGRRLSAVGRRDGRVFLLPAGRPPRPPVAALEAAITAIALTSDEGRVLVGGEGGELAVVGSDGAVGPVLKLHQDRVTSVGVGPGGWVATGSADRTVKLWKVLPATSEGIADLRLVLTLRFDGGVRRVAISDDGQLLTVLVAGERGVRRWRLESLASALADLGISLGRLPAPARTP